MKNNINLKPFLFSLILLLNSNYSHGQNNLKDPSLSKFYLKWSLKNHLIDAWVSKKDGTKDFGHFYAISDSTISLIPQIELKRENRALMITHYSNINSIKLREDNRKQTILLKFLPISIITGIFGGSLAYYIEGNDNKHLFGMGFLSGTGITLITSAIIGSFKLTIPIKGSYEKLDKNRESLISISATQ